MTEDVTQALARALAAEKKADWPQINGGDPNKRAAALSELAALDAEHIGAEAA